MLHAVVHTYKMKKLYISEVLKCVKRVYSSIVVVALTPSYESHLS